MVGLSRLRSAPGISAQRLLHTFDLPGTRLNPEQREAGASLVVQMVKNLPAVRETPVILPGRGRSPGAGYGNPLQYSCLENPMDRGQNPWTPQFVRSPRAGHD